MFVLAVVLSWPPFWFIASVDNGGGSRGVETGKVNVEINHVLHQMLYNNCRKRKCERESWASYNLVSYFSAVSISLDSLMANTTPIC